MEHVRANLRLGKSALRAFQEQPYWTASADALVSKVSLRSVQNMHAREGDDTLMSRDECKAVVQQVRGRDDTGVRDFRLVNDGRPCVIFLVCAPFQVSIQQMCALLPADVPLALYCDGKWKMSRLSRETQVM